MAPRRQRGGSGRRPSGAGSPGPPPTTLDEAVALLERGRLVDARTAGLDLLERRPADPNVLQLLGTAASRRGRFDEATSWFERLAVAVPASAVAWSRLGFAAMYAMRFESAASAFDRARELDPGLALAIRGAAELAERSGDPAAGLARLAPLLPPGSDDPDADAASAAHADPAVEPETRLLQAQLLVATRAEPAARAVVTATLARPDVAPVTRRKLLFTLGRAADRAGDPAAAADAWRRANAIGTRPFDADAHDREVDAIIDCFAVPPADPPRSRATSPAPVLVVGMPRSGSTLVEQILAAHPAVAGTGESTALPEVMAELARDHATGRRFPAWWGAVDGPALTRAGAAYVAALEDLVPGDRRVAGGIDRLVDKNLLNLALLGAAAELLPRARFVLCRRDAVELGLSCWMNDLSPAGFPWSGDLAAIGRVALAADRFIDHWPRVLGERVLVVPYEAMVEDPEAWSRRLVAHAGLDWDERCLRFHETGRAVTTLSYDQVRRPIYRSSVRRSDRYRGELGPLLAALGREPGGDVEATGPSSPASTPASETPDGPRESS